MKRPVTIPILSLAALSLAMPCRSAFAGATSNKGPEALAARPAAFDVSELYTESPGENPSWKELIEKGVVEVGSKQGKPLAGTRIDVNNRLLESNLGEVKEMVRPSSIHTHVRSGIRQKDFGKWSRWYQEDGNTQVFRLFEGEQSVRSKSNIKAGRIEAVRGFPLPKNPETWIEWQATYTIVKPGNGCIFQLMSAKDPETGQGGLWALHLGQSPEGDITMTRRRPNREKGEKKTETVARDVIGRNVTIKVLYDGSTTYEVHRKIHGEDEDFMFVGRGTYARNGGENAGFRWGIYQGSRPGSSIRQDCLLFVTGVRMSYRPDPAKGRPKAGNGTPDESE